MNFTFNGRTALLAGGSCEIGISLAIKLAENGIRPVITYKREKSLEYATAALKNISDHYDTLNLDLKSAESVEKFFENLKCTPDYIVDFAQEDYEALVASSTRDKISNYMEACITNRIFLLRKTTRLMMKNRFGRLVFVSSAAADIPNPGQGFYAASKLAAEAIYKNIAIEMGRSGISTVTLRPGYVDAGRGKTYIEKKREDILKRIPSGSVLDKEDVSATIMFLLSDQAKGFNATELTMDGGFFSGK